MRKSILVLAILGFSVFLWWRLARSPGAVSTESEAPSSPKILSVTHCGHVCLPGPRRGKTRPPLVARDSVPTSPQFREKFAHVDGLLREKKGKEASEVLEDILKEDPENEQALYLLGSLKGHDPSQREEAISLLNRALDKNPSHDGAMAELLFLSAQGDPESILSGVRDAFEKNPESTNLAAGLGRLVLDRGDAKSAIPLLEESSKDDYFALSSLNSLVEAYQMERDPAGLARTYERLISVHQGFLAKAEGEEANFLRAEIEKNQRALAAVRDQ